MTWVEDHTHGSDVCKSVKYKKSSDYGATWGSTILVSDKHTVATGECGNAGPPSMSVVDQKVYIAWPNAYKYVTTDQSDERFYHIYFDYSTDNGASWQTDIQVDDTITWGDPLKSGSRIHADKNMADTIGTSLFVNTEYAHVAFETHFNIIGGGAPSPEDYIRYDRAVVTSLSSWGTDQVISKSTTSVDGEDPVIAAYGTGNYVHVGFIDEDPYHALYYQRNTNDGASGSWYTNPVALTLEHVADPSNPDISVTEKYVHIVWEDSRFYGSSHIYYLRSRDNGANWDSSGERISDGTTDGNAGFWTSIAVDSSGNVHMIYRDGTDSDLKYAYCTTSCSTVQVDGTSIDIGLWNSLVLDSSGKPHVSYYDAANGDLKYAECLEATVADCTTAANWDKVTVPSTGDMGLYTSIDLDGNNKPYISYHDATNSDLEYAKCTASDCGTSTSNWNTYEVDTTGSVGYYTSIALHSSNNRPRISYYDLTNGDLKYAEWTGLVWNKIAADTESSDVGLYTSLEMDSNNKPHISYFDSANGDLKYAKCTRESDCMVYNNWDREAAHQDTSASVGYYTSIAVDSNGNPHISYYDDTNGDLKYAWSTGCMWCIEIVDHVGDVGKYSSIAVDSNDDPHISYYDDTNNHLKYAVKSGTSWDLVAVDEGGSGQPNDVGQYTSIALASTDNPYISYFDNSDKKLKYAQCTEADVADCTTAANWDLVEVDGKSNEPDGQHTSIALDSNDDPHISYYDGDNAELKYAECAADCDDKNNWDKVAVDTSPNTGTYTSIAIDSNDWMHISYFDDNYDILMYALCDESDCQDTIDWHKGAVDTTGFVGQYTSILIDSSDDAHISYLSVTGVNLIHASCTSTCTVEANWAKTTVESSGLMGQYTSIARDTSDNLHISHFDDSNDDLRHVVCTGSCNTASNWDGEVVDNDYVGVVGHYTSLALDSNNKPHIGYFHVANQDVWYAEKTGDNWNLEQVDGACNVGLYTSIDLDSSNNPFIGYYDETDTDIMYADKTGSAWDYTTVDSSAGSPFTYHKQPSIESEGATLHVAWVNDYTMGAPQCQACEIRFDTNLDNGDEGEWGTDDGIYPTAWPPYHVDRDALYPDIAAFGNDLHVVFMDIGTHANKQYEVHYTKEIDTISDGGDVWGRLKGAVTVKAMYEGGALPVNRVFVIGGENDADTPVLTDKVYMYDPGTDLMSEYCTLPTAIAFASAVWVDSDDKIYVFGGATTTSGNPTSKIYYIDLTNPATLECEETGDDLDNGVGLYLTSAIYDGQYAWIFGGKSTGYVDDIQRWDPTASEDADDLYDLNSARGYTSAVFDSSRDLAYIFGGKDASTLYDDILKFDTGSPGHTTILTTDLPSARDGTSAAFDGTYAYIFGGEDSSGLLDEVVRFNPEGNWDVGGIVTCKPLPDAVRDSSAAIVGIATITANNGLRVFGGDKGSGDNTDTISVLMISYWARF
jgi:hypothetical protein